VAIFYDKTAKLKAR